MINENLVIDKNGNILMNSSAGKSGFDPDNIKNIKKEGPGKPTFYIGLPTTTWKFDYYYDADYKKTYEYDAADELGEFPDLVKQAQKIKHETKN